MHALQSHPLAQLLQVIRKGLRTLAMSSGEAIALCLMSDAPKQKDGPVTYPQRHKAMRLRARSDCP